MASGLLLADALTEVLRRPYYQGNLNITLQYLMEGAKIGPHRVLVKRNFDTACWIPPVGSRDSHSIYYGDRMLDRIFDRFCQAEGVTMPPTEEFVVQVQAELAAAKASGGRLGNGLPPLTRVFNARLAWLQGNLQPTQWQLLTTWLVKAVASYGRHEREHARHTPQDLKRVKKDLQMFKIPFKWFNLFEDARIEHRSRADLGGRFDWLDIEAIAPANCAWNIFLRCIQLEGDSDVEALESEEPVGTGGRTVGAVAEAVDTYYVRACQAPTADHLYPILLEFLDEFKEELKPSKSETDEGAGKSESGEGGSGGADEAEGADSGDDDDQAEQAGDLSTAAEAAELGDDFFTEFEADAEVVGGTDSEGEAAEARAKNALKPKVPPTDPEKGKGSGGPGIPESIAPQASGGRVRPEDFLARYAGRIDKAYQARVDNLTAMLMRMFKTHTLPAATETPGHRISSRHLARGELRFVHKKVFGGKGKRVFNLVFDCSGSMSMYHGRPAREGKLLVLALNNLAKRGYLQGHLILSGYVNGRPGWLTYPFPVKDEIILRIHPDCKAEGLQTALQDNLKLLKGADDTFVVTDANICDAPLNRAFFASHRVWPVGLYAGKEDDATQMALHFPQNIIRDTIEQVVETMLTRNRRTVG